MTITEPTHEQVPEQASTTEKPWLFGAIGAALAVGAVVAAYLLIRFASIEAAVVVVALLLIALTVVGFLGARRGHAATFVAIALILPYLLGAVSAYASAQRVADVFSSEFSDFDEPESSGEEEPPAEDSTDSDNNEDGYDDKYYEGTNCTTISDNEAAVQECLANGGFAEGEDEEFVDPFADEVDPSLNPKKKRAAMLKDFPYHTPGEYPAEDACFEAYVTSDQTKADLEKCLKTI